MSRPEYADNTTTGGWGLSRCCCVHVWTVWGVSLMVSQSFKISEFNVSTIFYSYYLFVCLSCECGHITMYMWRQVNFEESILSFHLVSEAGPPCPPSLLLSPSLALTLSPSSFPCSFQFLNFFPHTLYPDQSFLFLCFSKHLHLPCPPDLLLHVPSEKSRFPRDVN